MKTLDATYLRVKNWARFQHYATRRPPWIKLYNDLIGSGDDFEHLPEADQWQLVRIWMVASKSSRFTLDPDNKIVPVLPNDEQSIRRSIQTIKRVPLKRFISDGWLIVVEEAALVKPAIPAASELASAFASSVASALLESEVERVREVEDQDQCTDPLILEMLGHDRYFAFQKVFKLATGCDQGSQGVVAALCKRLPASEIDDVRMVYAPKGSVPVGKLVNALKDRRRDYETRIKLVPAA